MAVSGVSSEVYNSDLYYSSITKEPKKDLDKNAFLQLFLLSLQNQDPTNPQDTNQFMSQMAQFTILEQLANVSAEVSKMKLAAEMDQATSLIGRTVKVSVAEGVEIDGKVERVTAYQGEIKLYLQDNPAGFGLDKVLEVS